MPKESKPSHHLKQPYPTEITNPTIIKQQKPSPSASSIEYVWEPYEQQTKKKNASFLSSNVSTSSNGESGGLSQLLGLEDPLGFAASPSSLIPSGTPGSPSLVITPDGFPGVIDNQVPTPTSLHSSTNIDIPNNFQRSFDVLSLNNQALPFANEVQSQQSIIPTATDTTVSPAGAFNSSFHIACTACREKHIKCDKKLPSCTYCVKHGLQCQYRKPKKRGRPSTKNKNGTTNDDSDDSGPVDKTGQSASDEMSYQLVPSTTSNDTKWQFNPFYNTANIKMQSKDPFGVEPSKLAQMDVNGAGMSVNTAMMLSDPLGNSSELDNVFSQMPQIDMNNENLLALIRMSRDLNKQLMKRLTVDDYYRSTSMPLIDQRSVEHLFFSDKRSPDANCFLYSIHMLMCQRKGFKEEAERAYEKTRSMLSSVFDQWRSFLIACTYCNLSIYCSGEGNDADAVFYLGFVDYYFTQLKEKFSLGQQNLRYLKSIAEMAAGVGVGSEKPIPEEVATELDADTINRQCQNDVANLLVGFYKYTTGLKKVPPELLQITSQNINQDTIYLYLTLFDMITKLVTTHETNRQRSLTPEQEEISKAICDAFINGTRVLILQQCGYKGKVLEDAANRIAEIFSNEISIGFASPLYMSSVIAACQVHIGIIEEIENGIRSNYEQGIDFYTMIDKDIKAMNCLDKQFGRVRKRYPQIISRLENIKQRRENEVSKLVLHEIERLKNLRSSEGKPTHDKSLLSAEHISSIYGLLQNDVQSAKLFATEGPPTANILNSEPNASSMTRLEDGFDDILNNL